eukprot:12101535-Heterocapsa_arctica.AAC.1
MAQGRTFFGLTAIGNERAELYAQFPCIRSRLCTAILLTNIFGFRGSTQGGWLYGRLEFEAQLLNGGGVPKMAEPGDMED